MFLVLTFCITTWGGGMTGFKSGTPAPAVRCSDHLATSFESFPQNIFFLLQGEALLVFPAASRIIMGDAGYEPVTTSLEVWWAIPHLLEYAKYEYNNFVNFVFTYSIYDSFHAADQVCPISGDLFNFLLRHSIHILYSVYPFCHTVYWMCVLYTVCISGYTRPPMINPLYCIVDIWDGEIYYSSCKTTKGAWMINKYIYKWLKYTKSNITYLIISRRLYIK